jgi:hypothetical protein
MNYEAMSDFDINRLVAGALGYAVQEIDDGSQVGMTSKFHKNYPSTVWVAETEEEGGHEKQVSPWEQFVPTHEWLDAGPIIKNNLIDIEWADPNVGNIGQCTRYLFNGTDLMEEFTDNSKALRAAMVVFLKMHHTN